MTSSDIQKLREITGAGIMDCKKALEEADGDMLKAQKILEERGLEKAEKKSGRATGAGIIESYIHADRIGALIELRTETDFVAKSDPIKILAKNIAMQIAAMGADSKESLLESSYIKDPTKTIKNLITEAITKVGENIQIGQFYRIEL